MRALQLLTSVLMRQSGGMRACPSSSALPAFALCQHVWTLHGMHQVCCSRDQRKRYTVADHMVGRL